MKSNFRVSLKASVLALSGAALLSACGGGGGDGYDSSVPPPAAVIPDSALVSGTAYAEYAKSLVKSETDKPVDISKVNIPPTSESVAPIAL
jgi:hypothetical protein